ncbi:MAG: isoprenylcysteine carboxylmethyltransferase family protein [Nitrospirae bacterium]|nr:isoprenylcysteine carboxylmethyltransferase family protein [Nitrospirota bacterium]
MILAYPEIYRPLGLALMLAGLGVASWALLTLRRFFSPRIMVQKDHQLIRRGPYQWIRHPFYLGLILLSIGFPLVFRSWLGMPVTILFFPAVAWRMTIEEKLLGDAFGAAYEEYKKTSWRLLPHVY